MQFMHETAVFSVSEKVLFLNGHESQVSEEKKSINRMVLIRDIFSYKKPIGMFF